METPIILSERGDGSYEALYEFWDDALCRQLFWDSDEPPPVEVTRRRHRIFFPIPGASARRAKAICAQCPVREQCCDYALQYIGDFGVFGAPTAEEGGYDWQQRRKERRRRQVAAEEAVWVPGNRCPACRRTTSFRDGPLGVAECRCGWTSRVIRVQKSLF